MIIVQQLRGELRELGRCPHEPHHVPRRGSQMVLAILYAGAQQVRIRVDRERPPFRSPVGEKITRSPEPVAEVISGGEYLDQVEGFERTANP